MQLLITQIVAHCTVMSRWPCRIKDTERQPRKQVTPCNVTRQEDRNRKAGTWETMGNELCNTALHRHDGKSTKRGDGKEGEGGGGSRIEQILPPHPTNMLNSYHHDEMKLQVITSTCNKQHVQRKFTSARCN